MKEFCDVANDHFLAEMIAMLQFAQSNFKLCISSESVSNSKYPKNVVPVGNLVRFGLKRPSKQEAKMRQHPALALADNDPDHRFDINSLRFH